MTFRQWYDRYGPNNSPTTEHYCKLAWAHGHRAESALEYELAIIDYSISDFTSEKDALLALIRHHCKQSVAPYVKAGAGLRLAPSRGNHYDES